MGAGKDVPWTEDEKDLVAEMHNRGLSAGRIAMRLPGGRSRNSIIGAISRMSRAGDPRIKCPMNCDRKPALPGRPRKDGATPNVADQQSLYIMQRKEWDGAPFTKIGNELARSSVSVRREYNAIMRDLAESEAA